LGGWQALAASGVVSSDLLASPVQVFDALREILRDGYRGTTLAEDWAATLGRCLVGFALAVIAGVPLGLLMGLQPRAAAALGDLVQFLRPLPPLSYMILLILWFGTGDGSKVALLFLTALPIIASAAMAGVHRVSRPRMLAARSLGAGFWQVVWHVVLPSSLPSVFTGLRIALAAAFSTVVAAELLAATNGLGWMVLSASRFLRSDVILLGIIILGLSGMALSRALLLLERRVVHWHGHLRRLWPWRIGTLVVLATAWVAATASGVVPAVFLPSPADLWDAAVDLVVNGYKDRSLLDHIGFSLMRVACGFVAGALVGTALGLAMGWRRSIDALFAPFIEFLRPLPQLAYLLLLIIWLGIGEAPKIVLLFLAALPVAAVAARDGVRRAEFTRMATARSLGASEWQVFRYVVLPSALPDILIGARLALGIVYGTLIAAEIIAGSTGLGWLIVDAGRFLRSEQVFVGVLIIGLMGVGLDRLLVLAEHRIVHWAGR
jgi:taurine transport system permease protein